MPRIRLTPRPPGGNPLDAAVPAGGVRCLRCRWPFATADRRTNRICPHCAGNPPALSRRELCEAGGGLRVSRE